MPDLPEIIANKIYDLSLDGIHHEILSGFLKQYLQKPDDKKQMIEKKEKHSLQEENETKKYEYIVRKNRLISGLAGCYRLSELLIENPDVATVLDVQEVKLYQNYPVQSVIVNLKKDMMI
ncbi:MAG: hypothetical protein MJB14_14870 [Spirochaetes bacterium]|nr:hypothetical protein [Spirochaetota bacterium]